jgi:phage tail-like protein
VSSRATAQGSQGHPDPVGELRFRVSIDAQKGLGWFTECSGLTAEWDVYTYDEGGLNDYSHKFRGRAKYGNLTLKRGITNEPALLKWFQQCSTQAVRTNITVQLMGPDAKPVRTWKFVDAFPVKWQGPGLNASSNNAAT